MSNKQTSWTFNVYISIENHIVRYLSNLHKCYSETIKRTKDKNEKFTDSIWNICKHVSINKKAIKKEVL